MIAYSVNAKKDDFEIHFEAEDESFSEIMPALIDAFPDVTITDVDTGELLFHWYIHWDLFIPKRTLLEVMALILKD